MLLEISFIFSHINGLHEINQFMNIKKANVYSIYL